MSAFKRIFARETKYYDLLEAGAVEARSSAAILARIVPALEAQPPPDSLSEMALCRRKHKRISQDVTAELCRNFVTPLEREDIEALSTALYKITKNVEKIAERLTIAPSRANSSRILKQLGMLERATSVVESMVRQLRPKSHGEQIKDEYDALQMIEGEADKLINDQLRELYHSETDARIVVFWKDVYEMFEKAIDRCRDAGYVVFHVALKYS
ncbi:MAG TPA: DUF47 family protein [Chthoniobacteraceae bacterium]|nr:DUF47 family protein [Chthoniobacteraceae bacterium]